MLKFTGYLDAADTNCILDIAINAVSTEVAISFLMEDLFIVTPTLKYFLKIHILNLFKIFVKIYISHYTLHIGACPR
ncbi:hypothetical protein UT300001_11000 [Clostridium sp. CTA-1]